MPKTVLGKWSLGFAAVFVVIYLYSVIMTGLSQRHIGDDVLMSPVVRPVLISISLIGIVSGLLAFITGLISYIKYKDKAVLVQAAICIGFFVVIFLVGEFLFPH